MSGKHANHPTIAFRQSHWARDLIEARAELSGIPKKDFITRCCVYSNIVVTGTEENIQRIIDALIETQNTMKTIAGELSSGDLSLRDEEFEKLRCNVLALAVTVVDILDGAAYLFNKSPPKERKDWKIELEQEALRDAIKNELPPPI
ncbi:MAG: hypothetical protein II059_13200 [Clostridia bacterium]|nr:hypothetical protein [Clostridia bacterium]